MKLSICCITYNHAQFIEECMKGFLLQRADFEFEIIISDDCSSDHTVKFIKEVQQKYPGKIKLLTSNENIGMMPNFIKTLKSCNGDYIALCEGDDYWIDPLKLQKQVDFLESNPDYAICFHRVYELENDKPPILSNLNISEQEETYTIEDLAKGNFIHTPSVVFRNGLFKHFPNWFHISPAGDYPLHMFNARHGKIKYFPQPMAVYRKNVGYWNTKKIVDMNINWYKTLDLLSKEFIEEGILKSLTQQKASCLIHIYDENDNDFLDKNEPIVKSVLDIVTRDLSKFSLISLLKAIFVRLMKLCNLNIMKVKKRKWRI